MSRVELHRIVTKDDKGMNEAFGPLALLYRLILFDLGISAATLEQQLDRWVNDPHSSVVKTRKKITQARGNYIKKMIEPSMTWKSFADLVMMLYPKYIRLRVDLGWQGVDADGNPKETTHSIKMDTSYLLNAIEEDLIAKGLDTEQVILNYSTASEGDEEDDDPFEHPDQLTLFDDDELDEPDYD